MKTLNFFVYFVGLCSVLALAAGYLGQLHPMFDSVSVFRLHCLISIGIVTLFMLFRRSRRGIILFGAAFGIGAAVMLPYFLPQNVEGDITFMQSNLLFRNDANALATFTQIAMPDILTLQEVSNRNRPNVTAMLNTYPHQEFCDFSTVGGVAVLSKFPKIAGGSGCLAGDGLVWMRVMTPKGAVTIASIHLYWPWPHGQAGQIDRLIKHLETLPRPVIIGGDFNNVAWSHNVHKIEAATGTHAISGIRLSFDVYKGWGRFPIDLVLIPIVAEGSAELGPTLGSDHNSILAYIAAINGND